MVGWCSPSAMIFRAKLLTNVTSHSCVIKCSLMEVWIDFPHLPDPCATMAYVQTKLSALFTTRYLREWSSGGGSDVLITDLSSFSTSSWVHEKVVAWVCQHLTPLAFFLLYNCLSSLALLKFIFVHFYRAASALMLVLQSIICLSVAWNTTPNDANHSTHFPTSTNANVSLTNWLLIVGR